MTFSKAKQEFQIRYYLWATSEFEKEIDESFPNFRSFKAGSVWELYQFMQQLNTDEQLTLAHGLLKRFHSDAVKAVGESCSSEEESLRSKRSAFWRIFGLYQTMQHLDKNQTLRRSFLEMLHSDAVQILGENWLDEEESLRARLDAVYRLVPSKLETEINEKRLAGKKIRFVSKRKLLKRMAEKFQNAFGSECLETDRVLEGDLSLTFEIKCCGWILNTFFWFGRGESLIEYSHNISSEDSVEQHGPKGIYRLPLVIGHYMSFCSWLGITSQTQWEYLMEEDVEPACDAAIKFCGHFFEVAPKLLKGLEFEKITAD